VAEIFQLSLQQKHAALMADTIQLHLREVSLYRPTHDLLTN